MTAVKAGAVEAALRRLDAAAVVLLLYGPDAGLVAERAKAAAERAVDDASDPFQLVQVDGDAIAADPARLVDEAGTIGLFGGRRAIRVKPSSRNLAPAVEAVLGTTIQECLVVIEAGDLAKSSPLRVLCEKSPKALALPCYADEGRNLASVVDEAVRAAGLTIARDARTSLLASLGGDRLATRSELAKLTLYAHGRREVTQDDIDAVVSDVSSLAVDSAVDAAFSGNLAGLSEAYGRLQAEGVQPAVLLGAALRHATGLLGGRDAVDQGRPAESVVQSWRGLHFRRRDAVLLQLRRWSVQGLARTVAALQEAVLETRRLPLARQAAERALWALATEAASGPRGRAA
jgi:DNA polymerase III subunit delta